MNITSDEFKARQYDHEVKGLSVVKPFIGKCRDVLSDATVTMIEPLSTEGIILSAAMLPRYSDIDTYDMMASSIDLAIRRVLAVGGKLGHMAGLDNFCWPDPVQSEKTPDGEYKLAQLVRANQALYDCTKAFKVPCVSGKDSMKNDSTRGGKKISIPPSVLFSVISKMDDIRLAVTLDAKLAGDDVYVLGLTKDELGGSEYYAMLGYTGNNVPKLDVPAALAMYEKVAEITGKKLAHSLHTPGFGGLAVAFAKTAMAGRLGMNIELGSIPQSGGLSLAELLFSESNTRFVMTASPDKRDEIAAILKGVPFARVGVVTDDDVLRMNGNSGEVAVKLGDLVNSYKSTLAGI